MRLNHSAGRRSVCAAPLLLLAVAFLFVVVLNNEGVRDEHPPHPDSNTVSAAPTSSTKSSFSHLASHFSILRDSNSEVPESVVQQMGSLAPKPDLSRARLVYSDLLRRTWAVPTAQRICLIDESKKEVGASCGGIGRVLKQGITITLLDDPGPGTPAERSIIGLVPNGVRQVQVLTPGYRSHLVQVQENVFVLTDQIPEPPEWIELISGRR